MYDLGGSEKWGFTCKCRFQGPIFRHGIMVFFGFHTEISRKWIINHQNMVQYMLTHSHNLFVPKSLSSCNFPGDT